MFRSSLKLLLPSLRLSKICQNSRAISSIKLFEYENYSMINIKTLSQKLHTNAKLLSEESNAQNNTLIVDDKALERLKKVLENNEALRIGVKGGGCSGFEYQFEIITRDSVNNDQDLILCDGLVIIDKESLDYMNGATLHYEEELIRSGFKISNNPLAEKGCSCGASFSLKF